MAEGAGWIDITALGLSILSLLLNVGNFFHAKNIRRANVGLEEFRRLRSIVDVSLADLRLRRDSLRAIRLGAESIDSARVELAQWQEDAASKYIALASGLRRLNESRYAEGEDWQLLGDQWWDDLSTTLSIAYDARRPEIEFPMTVEAAEKLLDDLIVAIDARLETEIDRLTK